VMHDLKDLADDVRAALQQLIATAVRSYELAHKHRQGVLDATEPKGTRS
jgi:hypothetical protein